MQAFTLSTKCTCKKDPFFCRGFLSPTRCLFPLHDIQEVQQFNDIKLPSCLLCVSLEFSCPFPWLLRVSRKLAVWRDTNEDIFLSLWLPSQTAPETKTSSHPSALILLWVWFPSRGFHNWKNAYMCELGLAVSKWTPNADVKKGKQPIRELQSRGCGWKLSWDWLLPYVGLNVRHSGGLTRWPNHPQSLYQDPAFPCKCIPPGNLLPDVKGTTLTAYDCWTRRGSEAQSSSRCRWGRARARSPSRW